MKFKLFSFCLIGLSTMAVLAQEKPNKEWHLMSASDNKYTAGIAANQAYELGCNQRSQAGDCGHFG
jgi:hypothetical protein